MCVCVCERLACVRACTLCMCMQVCVQELKYGWKISGVMRPRWFIRAECSISPARTCTHIHLRVGLWQVHFIFIACQLKASETILCHSQSLAKTNWFKFPKSIYGDETTGCSPKLYPDMLKTFRNFEWGKNIICQVHKLNARTDNHLKGAMRGKQGNETEKRQGGRLSDGDGAWGTDAGSLLAY